MQTTDKLSALSNNTLGDIIAELGKQFVKTDGSNATKAGTKAILGKLTGNDQVAKVSDLNTKVNVIGDNATDAGVNTMLGKLTDKVVKTVDLGTKVAEKAVVDAITASPDFTGKVYTKNDADTAFVKTADLATKVAEKAVVDVLVPALATDANDKGIYTKKSVDDALALKAGAAALANKADKNYVDTELGKKADSAALAAKANTADVYTKKSVDDALALKAGAADLANKANAADVYTKTAADTAFVKTADLATKVAEKAVVNVLIPKLAKDDGTTDIYTKKGVDDALALKAGAADLANKANAANVYTKTAADTAFVKATDLATKVAEKAVVDVLVPELAKDDGTTGIYTKKGVDDALALKAGAADLANKANAADVYTKTAADTALALKANAADVYTKATADTSFVKTLDLEKQAVAGKVLGAKDGDKSILVEKQEDFLMLLTQRMVPKMIKQQRCS